MEFIFMGCSRNIYSCRQHHHMCCETVIQYSGHNKTVIGKQTFNMTKGGILLIPPQYIHENVSDSPFSDMYIKTDLFPFKLTAPLLINDHSGNVLRLCKTLFSVRTKNDYNCNIISDGILEIIFNLISMLKDEGYSFPFTAELKSLIEDNFANNNFSIQNFTREIGYNSDYIRYGFKSDIGITPSEFLKKLRLEYAKKLLIQANFNSIKEIAYECGFDDQHYFSRAFKKYTLMSPKEYRDNEKHVQSFS